MVWAGVSLHHKTNIILIKGKLTAARNQHKVFNTEVIPFVRNHRGMQLLHNGATAHLARVTTAYLNANNVNVVDFPPNSPDLNIIENILDELNRGVRRTGAIPTTLNHLRAKNLYKWNNLPQNYASLHGHGRQYRI